MLFNPLTLEIRQQILPSYKHTFYERPFEKNWYEGNTLGILNIVSPHKCYKIVTILCEIISPRGKELNRVVSVALKSVKK